MKTQTDTKLTIKERRSRLAEVHEKTYNSTKEMLDTYHKALLVRFTGFGKSVMASRLMNNYEHILFFYPYNSIKDDIKMNNKEKFVRGGLKFYSYIFLASKSADQLKMIFSKYNSNTTLFIFDECHFIAAEKASIAIDILMKNICPDANYLGMTATPDRTDHADLKWHFFDGHIVYRYDIEDGFRDGLILRPYQVSSLTDYSKELADLVKTIDSSGLDIGTKIRLKEDVNQVYKPRNEVALNFGMIIAENKDKFENARGYYKFIVFCSDSKMIDMKLGEVIRAFQYAFPKHKVNPIIVTSRNILEKENAKVVKQLKPQDNTIDIIFTINMISMGFHVKHLTGIIMYRKTKSDITYKQQIGRLLDVNSNIRGIVFDLVDNENTNDSIYGSINYDEYKEGTGRELYFPEEAILLKNYSTALIGFKRLVDKLIRDEFEEECINAYLNGLVDKEYVKDTLHLRDEDFEKVLNRYRR